MFQDVPMKGRSMNSMDLLEIFYAGIVFGVGIWLGAEFMQFFFGMKK